MPAIDYAESLYTPSHIVTEGPDTFADVDDAAIERFHADGFLPFHRAFDEATVADAIAGIRRIVDFTPEEATELGVDLDFERHAKDRLDTLTGDERLDAVRKLMWISAAEPRLGRIAEHEPMLAVLTTLLGTRPQMFQDMTLLKPPGGGREKPWHQDNAYFNVPKSTPVVGVWIALDDATVANGCMRFRPGSHRDGPVLHFWRRDWQICDPASPDATPSCVAVPLPPGGCVIFDGLAQHGTPTNMTNNRRRAVQFHYCPQGTPKVSEEDRLSVFGADGKDATC